MAMTRAQRFMAMHDSGMTYQKIADIEGISRERVRQVIRSEFPPSGRMTAATTKARDSVPLPPKATSSQVADILGVKKHTARREMARRGVELLPVERNPDEERLARYKSYADRGFTYTEVAIMEGLSQPRVSVYCRRYGIALVDGRVKTK